jgi:hypothetical protein
MKIFMSKHFKSKYTQQRQSLFKLAQLRQATCFDPLQSCLGKFDYQTCNAKLSSYPSFIMHIYTSELKSI